MNRPATTDGIRILAVLVAVSLLAIPAWAVSDNETVGFNANHHYLQGFMGENLDILNGNLTLEIPIGPSYQTSTSFSYRLVLHYNSRIWTFTPAYGSLQGQGQFGLGFTMHFGRVVTETIKVWQPTPHNETIYFLETGDGARHPMKEYTVDGEEYWVTTDTSYILLKEGSTAGEWDAWMPDGTHLVIENSRTVRVEGPRWDRTDPDPENHVAVSFIDITYSSPTSHCIEQVADDLGRQITFNNAASADVPCYTTSIVLPGQNGSTITYQLNQSERDVHDPQTAPVQYPPTENLLDKIVFPVVSGGPIEMEFEYLQQGGYETGELSARVLPGGARFDYDYAWLVFWASHPTTMGTAHTSGVTCSNSGTSATRHIVAKHLTLPEAPLVAHDWTYARDVGGCGINPGVCPSCNSLSNPKSVWIHDPFGNLTKYNFHAGDPADMPTFPDPAPLEYHFWGMPYKIDYFQGEFSDNNRLVRSEEMEYESDDGTFELGGTVDPLAATGLDNWPIKANVRVKRKKTTYYDDGDGLFNVNPEVIEWYSDWTHLGHYRDSFQQDKSGILRKITTGGSSAYTVDQLPVDEWWKVGVRGGRWVWDPSGTAVSRTSAVFGQDGRLDWQATWDLPGTDRSEAHYFYDDQDDPPRGNLLYKKVMAPAYTGSFTSPSLSAGDCEPPLCYQTAYTYDDAGHLKTKQQLGLDWKSLDRDLDPDTGAVLASRSPGTAAAPGVQTSYSYDALGRLEAITPPLPEKGTSIQYPSMTETIVERGDQLTDQSTKSRYLYDSLGRMIETQNKHYNGGMTSQTIQYDILGRKTFQSEWVEGTPNPVGTTFDYTIDDGGGATYTDPLGRVQEVTTADGKVTDYEYLALETRVSVNDINNASQETATTVYRNDSLGRLVFVGSPDPQKGADATYEYDLLDNLTHVTMGQQQRWFEYDSAGRLTKATNPENSTVFFEAYDPLGNLLQKRDAAGSVFTYDYDQAGRPIKTEVTPPATPEIPNPAAVVLIENNYDNDPDPGDSISYGTSAGKLVRQSSYDDGGGCVPIPVDFGVALPAAC